MKNLINALKKFTANLTAFFKQPNHEEIETAINSVKFDSWGERVLTQVVVVKRFDGGHLDTIRLTISDRLLAEGEKEGRRVLSVLAKKKAIKPLDRVIAYTC